MENGIRRRTVVGLTVGIVLSFQPGWAQKPPPLGSGGGGGGTHLPPNIGSQPMGPSTGSINGSIYLTGNVMLDDGTSPPGSITIERVCGGAPRAQAYTDQKGRFSFQIGQTAGITQDASEEGSGLPGQPNHSTSNVATGIGVPTPQQPMMPNMQLANCDLRAVLAGYRSDTVGLGSRRILDDPNVGTIVLHRLANVEGSAISMTSLQAPNDARRAYNRAIQYLRKEKPEDAARELRKAVEIYPAYAAAWFELGLIQAQKGENGPARGSLEKAIAADAKYINPYVKLAELDAQDQDWYKLAATTATLLKLDAVDYPVAYLYNATANLNLNQLDEAEKSARAGEKLDKSHQYPKVREVLGLVLAQKKDYAGAADQLRAYLTLAPEADDAARMRRQLAEMERLAGLNGEAKAEADKS